MEDTAGEAAAQRVERQRKRQSRGGLHRKWRGRDLRKKSDEVECNWADPRLSEKVRVAE